MYEILMKNLIVTIQRFFKGLDSFCFEILVFTISNSRRENMHGESELRCPDICLGIWLDLTCGLKGRGSRELCVRVANATPL